MSEAKKENEADYGEQDGLRPVLYQGEEDKSKEQSDDHGKEQWTQNDIDPINFAGIPGEQGQARINREEQEKERIFFHTGVRACMTK